MTFRKSRKGKEEPIEIALGNLIIPYKVSTQFLEMTLGSRLNWNEIIDRKRVKAKKAQNIIKIVAAKKWRTNRKTLKKLY